MSTQLPMRNIITSNVTVGSEGQEQTTDFSVPPPVEMHQVNGSPSQTPDSPPDSVTSPTVKVLANPLPIRSSTDNWHDDEPLSALDKLLDNGLDVQLANRLDKLFPTTKLGTAGLDDETVDILKEFGHLDGNLAVRTLIVDLKQSEELVKKLSDRLQATLCSRDEYLGQAEKMAAEIKELESKSKELSLAFRASQTQPRSSPSSTYSAELVRRDVACSYEDITSATQGHEFDSTKDENEIEHQDSFDDESLTVTVTSDIIAKNVHNACVQTDLTLQDIDPDLICQTEHKVTFNLVASESGGEMNEPNIVGSGGSRSPIGQISDHRSGGSSSGSPVPFTSFSRLVQTI